MEEKNKISHRAIAIQSAKVLLLERANANR
jgi:inosine/xanthosine triphosphate pyrophosphatase family protein